ncbi:hypothetical protein TSO221_25190 [Azospirillum sp. TSO22-1]|nr:hypothetical protein TSO221_25190 [Azospirillum sp. TSO22-1]
MVYDVCGEDRRAGGRPGGRLRGGAPELQAGGGAVHQQRLGPRQQGAVRQGRRGGGAAVVAAKRAIWSTRRTSAPPWCG